MKILITGFEPFGGETVNPSLEAVRRISSPADNISVIPLQVPVEFIRSVSVVEQALEFYQPDAVVCVGQAGGRDGITPERIAINLDDAGIPDNAGLQRTDTPIDPNGPAAYFSTLPVKEMVAAMANENIAAHLSYSAGAYVCNHLMYSLLHLLSLSGRRIPSGFIHVPFLPQQVKDRPGTPCMSLDEIVRGLEISVCVIADVLAAQGR